MEFKQIFIYFTFFLILILINFSSSQIIINPLEFGNSGPTIITRQTFTVRGNDGTPVTITKINVHSGRNINGGNGRLTPFDLMRLADSRMNEFFEAIISRQIQLFNALEQEEENNEKENNKDNKEKENNQENNNKNENTNNTIDDKEFELDENNDKNKNENNNNDIKNDVKNEKKEEGEKDNNNKNNKNKNTRRIGKLTINEDNIKKANKNNNKKKMKKLTKKEIIFSRVCKYIFYSIILFTFYILIKKLLEILEIIDPENPGKNIDVNISNAKGTNEEKKEKEEKVENEVIINKEKENKQN